MNGDGNGIGAVLISPEQTQIPLALKPLHKQDGGVRSMHCRAAQKLSIKRLRVVVVLD